MVRGVGYSAIFSSFSSASAGVCVLFNNNFNFQILKSFSDPEGRFVIVDIKLDSKILTLVNIYAPNEDKPTFFQNVLNQLLCFQGHPTDRFGKLSVRKTFNPL